MNKFQLIQGGSESKTGPISTLRAVNCNETNEELNIESAAYLASRIEFLWKCIESLLTYAEFDMCNSLPEYVKRARVARTLRDSRDISRWASEIIELDLKAMELLNFELKKDLLALKGEK